MREEIIADAITDLPRQSLTDEIVVIKVTGEVNEAIDRLLANGKMTVINRQITPSP